MDSTILQPQGDYPANWQRMEFDHFTTLKRGKDLTRDQFRGGTVQVAGSNGVIGYHDTANVKAPGVTVGRSGSVGRVTYYGRDFWAHNTALFVTDFHGNDPRFAAYFLDILKLGRFGAGASVPTLDRNVFRTLPVIVPPLSEQRKIASVLSLVQRAIEQQERLIALTTELKKALMHKLFTEGLRGEPQKMTEIGPVPESWDVVLFEEFALLQRGFDLPRTEFRDGLYPVIGATTTIGFHYKWNVKGPGVTVVRSGSSVGKPQFVGTDFWAHNVVLFVKDFHGHNPKFVYYKIQNFDLTKYREGVAVPTLNRNSFRTIPVAVPKREEQDQFVQVLDAVEQKEDAHRRKHAALTSLFRALLHQLMTARIRVHDLDPPRIEVRDEHSGS